MPSDKRARQRAYREQKLAAESARQKRTKRLQRVGGAAVVVAIIVGIIALVSGNSTPKKAASTSTTTTTLLQPVATTSSTTTTLAGTPVTAPVSATAIAPTCPPAAGTKVRSIHFTKAPALCISATGVYDATFVTDVGTFTVRMPAASSLEAVNNFVFLARYHYFDGTVFHRVIPGFVVQGGDPTATGTGGPGYAWTGITPPKACSAKKDCYAIGSLDMANSSGPSTNGSQFFLVLPGGQTVLDPQPNYTDFGQVTNAAGLAVVEKIGTDGSTSGTPKVLHHIVKVTITQIS